MCLCVKVRGRGWEAKITSVCVSVRESGGEGERERERQLNVCVCERERGRGREREREAKCVRRSGRGGREEGEMWRDEDRDGRHRESGQEAAGGSRAKEPSQAEDIGNATDKQPV